MYKTNKQCTACGVLQENGNVLHHIKTRGSGGSDKKFNLMPLCNFHHNQVHQIGLYNFSLKYKSVTKFLINHKWELNNYFGKYKWICTNEFNS